MCGILGSLQVVHGPRFRRSVSSGQIGKEVTKYTTCIAYRLEVYLTNKHYASYPRRLGLPAARLLDALIGVSLPAAARALIKAKCPSTSQSVIQDQTLNASANTGDAML